MRIDKIIIEIWKEREWIFSGLGTEIVGFIKHFVMRKKSDKKLDINNTKLEDINNVLGENNQYPQNGNNNTISIEGI